MGTIRSIRGTGRVLRVGATPVPHAEILDHVRPVVARDGIDLHVEVFDTFDEPNHHLVAGTIDANFFQYLPFLDEFNASAAQRLVPVAPVHIEPFALYSESISALGNVPQYAQVALPGDPANVGRALHILRDLGLVTLRAGESSALGVASVIANPKQLLFKEIASAHLADVLADFDLVFLFGNYAMDREIDLQSALYCDHANRDYAEYLVARPDNHESEPIRLLARALQSDSVRSFIARSYGGLVVPAF
ncbi:MULTISPECIES: MetQ/NlpA family ABC transporter substrate-binding protein [unclassified Mycobacterium]|uniref:MetQ/NlpA family ABC transporter substrate-binding protein n=1 Tax=unclassified Mycobacterium TaxID=2642494 RepID=UPI00048EFBBC|nr:MULTISPECIES: MetQ/NlpA family ABC transporter substrate-binding protein [unclassified Mycobacterium]SEB16859.1 D-methionine transport system substrate-binding protein [Mycobacterium sp. 283mftsu]